MGLSLTFSWLKESILLMAVSKAVMESRKAWSCSHSGLLSRSAEIFTAALDMADKTHTNKAEDTVKTHTTNFVKRQSYGHIKGYLPHLHTLLVLKSTPDFHIILQPRGRFFCGLDQGLNRVISFGMRWYVLVCGRLFKCELSGKN